MELSVTKGIGTFFDEYHQKVLALNGINNFKLLKLTPHSSGNLVYNSQGPIAFIIPELGRWSTIGELGIMVDDLFTGLAQLGEEVICISPYYDRNSKGETGYLAKDLDNIRHIFNVEVSLGDGKYIVGVHSGKVKGVTQYFLHNPLIFPHPYVDGDACFTIQQLALMAKACLEIFCVTRKIPALIVTKRLVYCASSSLS